MAVEVESGSQIEEFLRVLRRRSWWIVIPTILVIAVGTTFAVIVPKKYVARTTVLVRNKLENVQTSGTSAFDEAKNAQHHLKSGQRITQVLETLQWPDYLQLNRTEIDPYIQQISTDLKVDMPPASGRETQLVVKVSFAHTDRNRCFDFLVKASEIWRNEVLERGRTSELDAYEGLRQDKQDKEEQRDEVLKELKELHQQHQIDPSPQGGGRGFTLSSSDPVYAQVAADQITLGELEAEITALGLEIGRKQAQHDKMPPSVTQTRAGSGGVDNAQTIIELRSQITAKREKQARYKKDHSEYRLIERDVAALDLQIRLLEEGEEDPVTQEQDIPNKDRIDLGRELDEERMRLAGLVDQRDLLRARIKSGQERINSLGDAYSDIRMLEAEKDTLDEAITVLTGEIARRKPALDLLLSPQGNPFDIIDEPRLPGRPSEPDPLLIVLFSVFIGLATGLALAVGTEYSKSCFRSVPDISRVMVVPVLGAINTIATRRDRLRVRATHALVGGVTFLFVATLAFLTWAWAVKPQMLSNRVRSAIEDLREGL